MRAVCCRFLDDAGDVDEAVRDSFVEAWRNLERFRGDAALCTWLRKPLPTNELQETGGSSGEDASAANARSAMRERLRALPDEYRAAVVPRDVERLSNDGVAETLGISLTAAKSRVRRGRMQPREPIERWKNGS